ncbi:MAG: hypothetical protein HUU54_08920 [Ignavibacteriaceae bacterium]|nr:hypothetical protein [Ignavibacteriaceae bacterium]
MKDKAHTIEERIKPFREIDVDSKGRDEVLDDFILALDSSDLDSAAAEKYLKKRSFTALFLLITGGLLSLLAGVIILVPLPKFLEVKTLFYFNPNDGITVSDIAGVIILLTGIIIAVTGISLRRQL